MTPRVHVTSNDRMIHVCCTILDDVVGESTLRGLEVQALLTLEGLGVSLKAWPVVDFF